MKLPFIEHIGIGLHITGEAIRWVELSRIRDRVKIRSTGVDIEEGDIKSSLATLVERVNPSMKYVSVNIDPNHVRQKLMDVPDFEDEEYLENWLREQEKAMVPAGLKDEDFISSHRFLGQPGDDQQCLVLISSKKAVEARIALLESVGLQPSIITTGDLEAGYACIFDPEFTTGESCLIKIFEDYSSLQFYSKGILTHFVELTSGEVSISEIFEEAETYLVTTDPSPDKPEKRTVFATVCKQFLTKSGFSELTDDISEVVTPLTPLANIQYKDTKLDSDLTVAAGMAVKQVYPALDTINFLEGERGEYIREEIQKKDAVNSGLIFGGFVVLAFTLLMAAQFFLQSKLDKANEQIVQLDDKITVVNEARERVEELEQRVSQARELIGERTDMAGLLEMAGRSVPQRVWLSGVDLQNMESGVEASLYGFAFNDALVASLMERLENERSVNNVRLIFSEMIAAEDVFGRSGNNQGRSLVQFEIRTSTNSDIR